MWRASATTAGTGANSKNINIALHESSDNSNWANMANLGIPPQCQLVDNASVTSKYAATNFRLSLPPSVKRYIRAGATGEARLTGGHALPARHVIHTVGPVWRGGDHGEADLLRRCYRGCFALAREHGLGTLAFPAISCGVYRFPAEAAVAIAVTEARVALAHAWPSRVIFACFWATTWTVPVFPQASRPSAR